MNRLCARAAGAAGLCALLAGVAGCGRGPAFAAVEGVIRVNGKPLDRGEVVFMPDPDLGHVRSPRASAFTDADGRYRLTTDQTGRDGAMVGTHRVVVIDIGSYDSPDKKPLKDGKPREVSLVPPAYTSPATTPLRAEVKAGKQTLDFDLKSP